jgi:hypothetical protein
LGKRVVNTSVYLYDKIRERIVWCVGTFGTIVETFSACTEFARGIGQPDAFMIPSKDEEDTIWFDSESATKFCFKIKVEVMGDDERMAQKLESLSCKKT